MDVMFLPKSWDIDQILNDLDQYGFSIIDHAYTKDYIRELNHECMTHLTEFRNAGIQNGIVSSIRSDHILWIDEKFKVAQQHIHNLNLLISLLNRNFFLTIREVEAHFACYNAGEFYALHRDNPQGKNGRIISTVFYLHSVWQEDWGGELHLQDKLGNWQTIQPKANRLAIFQSDLMHEVLIAKHQRLSITAWLRSDSQLI